MAEEYWRYACYAAVNSVNDATSLENLPGFALAVVTVSFGCVAESDSALELWASEGHSFADCHAFGMRCSERVDARSMAAPGRVRPGTRVEALRLVLWAHEPRLLRRGCVLCSVGAVSALRIHLRLEPQ